MHRQSIIFVSLLLIITVAIVAVGYATGRGPLAVVSEGISRLTSGGQMIPSGSMTEENKAPSAPEISSGLWINSEPLMKYPVVTDQDYSTWKAYGVEAWPTLFVLDKQGRVRWTHVGEGYYDETEEVIKKLLAEEAPG